MTPLFRSSRPMGNFPTSGDFQQQVGRVLRNPKRKHGQSALVFGRAKGLPPRNGTFHPIRDAPRGPKGRGGGAAEVVHRVIETTSRLNYLDGQFRGPCRSEE